MKVYFTAATNTDPATREKYAHILRSLKKYHVTITSGTQIADARTLEQDQKQHADTDIFKRQKALIDASDCVCAEVTHASIGVGGEIVYALTQGKKVLALLEEGSDRKLSPMLMGNPSDNLYKTFYCIDRLDYIIKDFLDFFTKTTRRKGKFIVIDGGDGSGKGTQAKLLLETLTEQGHLVRMYDFPRYTSSFHGEVISRFLRGEFGSADVVSPYLISLAYALDRASLKTEMEDFLSQGGWIVSNRYTSASMGHQTSRIKGVAAQKKFLEWLYTLEYKVHKIPKEDLVVYLDVPAMISSDLVSQKSTRSYLGKKMKKDINESNLLHQIDARKMFMQLCKKYPHWRRIDCIDAKHQLRSIESVHDMIVKTVDEAFA
ncbi:MAG: nucleoside 2-deoxyribosyltransferase [Candidatus Roizmanbacteria bacterium]